MNTIGKVHMQKCRLIFKRVPTWQHCCGMCSLQPLCTCVRNDCILGRVSCVLEVLEQWCVRAVRCIAQFEQRANLKFLLKLGKSTAVTPQALQTVHGDDAFMKNSHVWLVQPLQNWARTAGRGASPWETFKICKCCNNFTGEEDGVCWPTG